MVGSITSLTGNGLADFVVQRVSAVVMTLYTLCVVGFFLANPDMDFETLRTYFASVPMVLFSTLMVLSTTTTSAGTPPPSGWSIRQAAC